MIIHMGYITLLIGTTRSGKITWVTCDGTDTEPYPKDPMCPSRREYGSLADVLNRYYDEGFRLHTLTSTSVRLSSFDTYGGPEISMTIVAVMEIH